MTEMNNSYNSTQSSQPTQGYYQPYSQSNSQNYSQQLNPSNQSNQSQNTQGPKSQKPIGLYILIGVILIAIAIPGAVLVFKDGTGTNSFEQRLSQEFNLANDEAKILGSAIKQKTKEYDNIANPSDVGDLVVADLLSFEDKIASTSALINPKVVKEEVKPQSDYIFLPPLGSGIPQEGVKVLSGEQSSFVLDYGEYATAEGQIDISQDVILYNPEGRIIPGASYKDFFTLSFDASNSAFVPIVNSVKIPTSYPQGTYVLEVTVHNKNTGGFKVVRLPFDVKRELHISEPLIHFGEDKDGFLVVENNSFTYRETFEVYSFVEGFEMGNLNSYNLEQTIQIIQNDEVVFEIPKSLVIDDSYDLPKDRFEFRNTIKISPEDKGKFKLRLIIKDLISGTEVQRDADFTIN